MSSSLMASKTIQLTSFGHSAILLEQDGRSVLIDPFLSGNPACATDPLSLRPDAIILTHGHGDHLGDAIRIALHHRCPIVAIFELAMWCAAKGVPVKPMNLGGQTTLDNGVRIRMTPAWHSSSIEDNGMLLDGGSAAGIIADFDGVSVYHAGDTALFGDMKLIGELYHPDIACLPIGDVFTMGPDEAVLAARWTGVRHVIPIHYNTFPPIEQDPHAFAAKLAAHGIQGHVPAAGEPLTLTIPSK